MADALGFRPDPEIRTRHFKIGCIGAGFIMADVQLAAYHEAGFPVVAIASRSKDKAAEVAKRWNIGKVHDTPQALIENPRVEIVDIAFPPDQQPELIRHALAQRHIKAILAQKPLAMDFETAKRLAADCRDAGKILSVNQNMRFDQSMRVLKQILDRHALGDPVLATIEMRAIPHWQPFLRDYGRLTLLNMSIHHLDVLRFLFGDPVEIQTVARPDPRTAFPHKDGITVSTLRFPSDVLAVSLEDVWSGPREDGYESDIYIKWRVEGTDGAVTPEMIEAIVAHADRCNRDDEIRVVIVTGAGLKSFCAGSDIGELDSYATPWAFRSRPDYCDAIRRLVKPAIAAVNGYAFGGGLETAMSCDIRIASANARFAAPEIKLGWIGGGGMAAGLAHAIGPSNAALMILTGDPIDAEQALAWGLVSEVLPQNRLLDRAREIAGTIATRAPIAAETAKLNLRAAFSLPLEKAIEYERDLQTICFATEDAAEGRRAFKEKRPPDFRRR